MKHNPLTIIKSYSTYILIAGCRLTLGLLRSTDDVVLLQMGTMNPGRTDEEKKEWTNGLRLVIKSLREKGAQDAEAVAKEIADYRRRFLGDPAMVLNI